MLLLLNLLQCYISYFKIKKKYLLGIHSFILFHYVQLFMSNLFGILKFSKFYHLSCNSIHHLSYIKYEIIHIYSLSL